MEPFITDDIFAAYLKCETKAHLIAIETQLPPHHIHDWQVRLAADYKTECLTRLLSANSDHLCCDGTPSVGDLLRHTYNLVLNCTIGDDTLQAHVDALQLSPPGSTQSTYIPVLIVPHDTVTHADKLLLAFDALALAAIFGIPAPRGQILHGVPQRATSVNLVPLVQTARHYVSEISSRLTRAPAHRLNRHCTECVFESQCRDIATAKDDLSLLANMNEQEIKKQHGKGIFTVTQLSYTFRPRRRPAKHKSASPPYRHALKALAIRDSKIYVVDCPNLQNLQATRVPIIYLDVEGIPSKQFYYLVGLRVCDGTSTTQHSFWADSPDDERQMWADCIRVFAAVEGARIVCFGQFDRTFLRRMKTRYPDVPGTQPLIDELLTNSINVVSIIYGHVYFPTYSNGLKQIASYLAFHWTYPGASGLHALMWRSQWDFSRESALKNRLIAYNIDDCKALEVVCGTLAELGNGGNETDGALHTKQATEAVQVESLRREYPQRFRTITFATPELAAINRCAYWDYQRSKVYVRTSESVRKAVRKEAAREQAIVPPINATVIADQAGPRVCPKCGATTDIYKHARLARIVYDVRFTKTSVKRWVVRYRYSRYYCTTCSFAFQVHRANEIYGPSLRALVMYYMIELRVPQNALAPCISQLFNLQLGTGAVNMMKTSGALFYESLYSELLKRVTHGRLLHVDETKVSIRGKEAFVWVFANLEEVVYVYCASREATMLHEALSEFKGVLVSDFYAAYDGVCCAQQKCLIHLIRDLNDALLKEPFNDELRTMMSDFSRLLKDVIDSVDRFGLKSCHLKKHKNAVATFFQTVAETDWKSDAVKAWRKRFEKNRKTLFTFLDYDGIPWNNNNAEHAIKKFAFLRHVIGGSSSEVGIREYLVLLSIWESCNLKGIPFLSFLRSGETSLDRFLEARPR